MSSYLGVPPQSGFITTAKQRVTSSTNNYVDLDHSISSLADVIVWVNFVKQDSTNLTLTTSSRITLGANLVASDICEIAFLGKAVATQNPSTNSVTNDMLVGSIANSKLSNSSITLNGSAVSLGGSASVDNTPYFLANRNSSNQTLTDNTWVKLQCQEEKLDSDGTYDNSTNYRWTPAVVGKYRMFACIRMSGASASNIAMSGLAFYKNGSVICKQFQNLNANYHEDVCQTIDWIETMDADDYIELYGLINDTSGDGYIVASDSEPSAYWGGYKLLT